MITASSKPLLRALALAGAVLFAWPAHAQLFGDDQARQAILDLRQRFDQAVTAQNRLVDENTQMRRSMLELQQQIELLRGDLARARGQEEQLQQEITELKKGQTSALDGLDQRLLKLEKTPPANAEGTGASAPAGAEGGAEKQDYDAALAVFRKGDYAGAQSDFANFVKRYPSSALAPAALFWLGNAQYATRNYKEAITHFKALLAAAPNHARAPEAALSIANCQMELKETRGARKTLEDLLVAYPKSEAASTAKERLAQMK